MTTIPPGHSPDDVLTIPLTVRIRRFRGALQLAQGQVSVELDEVAAQVYKRLDGRRTVRHIARELTELYSVDEKVTLPDVLELAGQLVAWGMASPACEREPRSYDR